MSNNLFFKIFFLLEIAAIGFLAGMFTERAKAPVCEAEVKSDTLVVRDTIKMEKPVYVTRRTTDTLLVAIRDTVVLRDTAFISLPKEQRVYADSTFRAVISGFRPSLDTMTVYPVTKYITTERTIPVPSRKRWGIGVQAGYGAHVHGGRIYAAPYVGVGISYNLIRW